MTWHPPFQEQLLEDPEDYGFWAVTRYDDLVEVTKRHEDFLSGPGILMENLPAEFVEAGQSIIGMDPPRHTKLRRLVAAAFTPKQMRRINDRIEANAKMVVENLAAALERDGGQTDFVAECAELLPMHNINDIMGVPDGQRQEAAHQMKVGTSWNDPELVGETREEVFTALLGAMGYMHELASTLTRERREHPTDDLITALAQAEVDGEKLTDHEIGAFFVLLTIAGNDTTRQSTSHGLRGLTDFPDQRAWLLDDLDARLPDAVEEMVRWATPDHDVPAHRVPRLRTRRPADHRRRQGRHVLLLGQPRRDPDRAPARARPLPPPQPAHQLRRRRHPPLPGQPARPLPAQGPVQGTGHPVARPAGRRTRTDPGELLQRRQAHALLARELT